VEGIEGTSLSIAAGTAKTVHLEGKPTISLKREVKKGEGGPLGRHLGSSSYVVRCRGAGSLLRKKDEWGKGKEFYGNSWVQTLKVSGKRKAEVKLIWRIFRISNPEGEKRRNPKWEGRKSREKKTKEEKTKGVNKKGLSEKRTQSSCYAP